jgi:predicted XRE-type DNA-binding protein
MSNTNITTTTDTTTVTVTENVVEIELNNVGVQGTPGLSGVVSVVSPITNVGSAGSAIVGINQALLSITKSQVSDFASGTVTSAGTAQQAGTALFATNASTAVFATTSGTATYANAAEQTLYLVRNNTGTTILKGTLLAASGAEPSGRIDVEPFVVTGLQDSELRVMGVATANISNGVNGTVMSFGTLVGVDTRGNFASALAVGDETWAVGDILFAHPTVAGKLTKVRPQHDLAVAFITVRNATAGQIAIRIVPGNFHLEWLHDVSITSPTNNQVLTYDSASSLWVNANNPADGVTSITATAPLTGGTITSTGSIGLDQTALSITKSQVSDFTSGTVTSASTAQQAGTALFANTSGTATYSTTSGTALTISGEITRSQVSDFASGTVAQATNASTAVSVSGSAITQSQVVNLVSDLAGKANLAGGNAFTGAQTVTGTAIGSNVLRVLGASGQTANIQEWVNGGVIQSSIGPFGNATFGTTGTVYGRVSVNTGTTGTIGQVIRGVSGQTAAMLQLQNESGGVTANFTAPVNNVNRLNLGGTDLSATFGITVHASGGVGQVIRAAASQTADIFEIQNSAGTDLAYVTASGDMWVTGAVRSLFYTNKNNTGGYLNYSGNSPLFEQRIASEIGLRVRGAASQTAELQQWQNSGGTVLASINASGDILTNAAIFAGTSTWFTATLNVRPLNANVVGAVIRGQASQVSDLQQWQNSAGTVLAFINSGGVARFENLGTANGLGVVGYNAGGGHATLVRATSAMGNPGANAGRLYFRDGTNAGTLKLVVRAGTAGAETTILDNIPQ